MDHAEHAKRGQGHSCGCGGPGRGKPGSRPAALDVLDERFARGEIEKAEYEEKKLLISQRPDAPKAKSGNPQQTAGSAKKV
jgi:hypothetical protein